MRQHYADYSNEDHQVWQTLFERQYTNLPGKAIPEVLDCLSLGINVIHGKGIPDFRQLNVELKKATGWTIEVVPGLIPVEDFFRLLVNRRFPSSTWLRRMSQLDYLEEPDMFHDIFGHVPLLFNEAYADFMQEFGRIGLQCIDTPHWVAALERLYWFTIEFGLCYEAGALRIMGAGILSSFGETNQIFEPDAYELRNFDLESVLHHSFCKSEMQTIYYALPRFTDMFDVLDVINQRIQATPVSSL